MYCNINEAFSGNSNYIKSYLDNELNNQQLLEKYNNFDSFFSNQQRERHQQLPNNIIEHFVAESTPILNKSETSNMVCDKTLDHLMKCSHCQKTFIKLYIKNFFTNFSLDNGQYKNIISLGLIIMLFIILVKLVIKI